LPFWDKRQIIFMTKRLEGVAQSNSLFVSGKVALPT